MTRNMTNLVQMLVVTWAGGLIGLLELWAHTIQIKAVATNGYSKYRGYLRCHFYPCNR